MNYKNKNINPDSFKLIEYFPTFPLFKSLINNLAKVSLTRALQNYIIQNYNFHGDLLDFGGGEKSQYRSFIQCKTYSSINIDPEINPTWVIDDDEKFPCKNNIFDHIFSFNTLEHVYNAQEKLAEFYRVLKPGGDILISTPFLYPIHGHPDDFFRPSPSWYHMTLKKYGFKNIHVIPLFWGPFSTGLIASGIPGPLKNIRKYIALLMDYFYVFVQRLKYTNQEIENKSMPFSTAFVVQAIK